MLYTMTDVDGNEKLMDFAIEIAAANDLPEEYFIRAMEESNDESRAFSKVITMCFFNFLGETGRADAIDFINNNKGDSQKARKQLKEWHEKFFVDFLASCFVRKITGGHLKDAKNISAVSETMH